MSTSRAREAPTSRPVRSVWLPFPVENWRHWWRRPLLAGQNRFEPPLHILLPDAPAQILTASQSLGNLNVGPSRPPFAGIGMQQNPRSQLPTCRTLSLTRQTFQLRPLRPSQFDNMRLLSHFPLHRATHEESESLISYQLVDASHLDRINNPQQSWGFKRGTAKGGYEGYWDKGLDIMRRRNFLAHKFWADHVHILISASSVLPQSDIPCVGQVRGIQFPGSAGCVQTALSCGTLV